MPFIIWTFVRAFYIVDMFPCEGSFLIVVNFVWTMTVGIFLCDFSFGILSCGGSFIELIGFSCWLLLLVAPLQQSLLVELAPLQQSQLVELASLQKWLSLMFATLDLPASSAVSSLLESAVEDPLIATPGEGGGWQGAGGCDTLEDLEEA